MAAQGSAIQGHDLGPVTVLHGHTTGDTAYVAEPDPVGGMDRRTRYWLHTVTRGAGAGRVRLMEQGELRNRPGAWRPPMGSEYADWAVLYVDARGRVGWSPIGKAGPNPWLHLRMRLQGIFGQLSADERLGYGPRLETAMRDDPKPWVRAGRAYLLLAGGTSREELAATHGLALTDTEHQIAVAALAAGLRF
jgi:hypothetical protein